MDILIIGGGTRAKVVMDAVARAGVHRVVGFLHDLARPGEELMGSLSLGRIDDLPEVTARASTRAYWPLTTSASACPWRNAYRT